MLKQLLFIGVILTNILDVYSQDSLNIKKLSHVSGLPGNVYNDCWGYVNGQGEEFAIIGSSKAINIFNITNPMQPILDTSIIDGTTTVWRDFKTYQNFAYAVSDQGREGLEIINLDNYTMTQDSNHFFRSHNIFIDTTNARLYVVGSNTITKGMIIYDLSNPSLPSMIKKINLDTLPGLAGINLYIHDIYVRDNIAYASHGYSGFYMWDLNDLNNIFTIGSYNPSSSFYNHSSWVSNEGDYLYYAEEVPIGRPIGICHLTTIAPDIIDIAPVGTFSQPLEYPNFTNNRPHNPFIKGNELYISYYHDGLQVYDITDKTKPWMVAYYDTYIPNNGNGYSNYAGAWGTYPFLPSGTIIVSDIETGLYLLKLNFPKVSVDPGYLYIEQAGKGVILKDSLGVQRTVMVDESGTIQINPTNQFTSNDMRIHEADLELNLSSGIILRGKDEQDYLLNISDVGVVAISQLTSLPSNIIYQSVGNVIIDNKNNGIVIQASSGTRWKVQMNNVGQFVNRKFSF